MAKSKTQQALDWLAADPRRSAYQASKNFDVSQQAISAARKKLKPPPICQHCGMPLKGHA